MIVVMNKHIKIIDGYLNIRTSYSSDLGKTSKQKLQSVSIRFPSIPYQNPSQSSYNLKLHSLRSPIPSHHGLDPLDDTEPSLSIKICPQTSSFVLHLPISQVSSKYSSILCCRSA